ncbi:hypothetical protein [Amycolatopsis minnesotensis]|uniref:Uncharacterized protein n=1 Tax=Amycolatopsis minnesotensis TaxID=337894 RepID=A0ABN2QTS3_9PSEU
MTKAYLALAAVCGLCGLVASPAAQADPAWQRVGSGITGGVSGMAVTTSSAAETDAVIVRDNKEDGENRVAVVRVPASGPATSTDLAWSGELPSDLEAIDAVPGKAGEFVALASSGTAYLITVDSAKATVVRSFSLPDVDDKANYEGFALATIGGKTVAVWADRGKDKDPGVVSAAAVDLGQGTFSDPVSAKFTAPYPEKHVRHVSDVKVRADGGLLISSASDNGDDGPFDSALYRGGTVKLDGDRVALDTVKDATPVAKYQGHKIEALACGSASGVLGTDDENLGGFVRLANFC